MYTDYVPSPSTLASTQMENDGDREGIETTGTGSSRDTYWYVFYLFIFILYY